MNTPSFRTLKRLVSVETVLAEQNRIEHLRQRSNRLVGPCPIHRVKQCQRVLVAAMSLSSYAD